MEELRVDGDENGSSGSVSPSPSSIGSEGPLSPARVHRMASNFQLGDEQPSSKPTSLTKASADSFNNLFGPPTPAKAISTSLKSAKQTKVAPAGLVATSTKRIRKPLPINPLTGQVIGTQTEVKEAAAAQQEETLVVTKRSPGGNHSQLW